MAGDTCCGVIKGERGGDRFGILLLSAKRGRMVKPTGGERANGRKSRSFRQTIPLFLFKLGKGEGNRLQEKEFRTGLLVDGI